MATPKLGKWFWVQVGEEDKLCNFCYADAVGHDTKEDALAKIPTSGTWRLVYVDETLYHPKTTMVAEKVPVGVPNTTKAKEPKATTDEKATA